MDLFEFQKKTDEHLSFYQPLAEILRPKTLDEFVGQQKVLGIGQPLRKRIEEKGDISNLILWGPPGTGKTTFARLLAHYIDAKVIEVSAVDCGSSHLKTVAEEARRHKLEHRKKSLLFIDEIHRLNKMQQDILLPYSERGDFILVGATTENPGYELNNALLSRCQLVLFENHTPYDLRKIGQKAFAFMSLDPNEVLTENGFDSLTQYADGDARRLVSWIEELSFYFRSCSNDIEGNEKEKKFPLDENTVWDVCGKGIVKFDRKGDLHYDCISAFIKSIRGSDPDAGLYYLARMLAGGEDPVFISRRLIILSSEDIGNADPRALSLAVAGLQAVEAIGLPEAAICLAQIVTYLACAPKSNSSYVGFKNAQTFVEKTGSLPIPTSLRSGNNFVGQQLQYGKDYLYSHQGFKGWVKQDFLPQQAIDKKFFELSDRGFEKHMKQYLDWLKNIDLKK